MLRRRLKMTIPATQREQGAGLLMVLLASALLAAIVAATTVMIETQTKERVMTARQAQRIAAYEFVKTSLSDPSALRLTALSNSSLRNCIEPGGAACRAGITGASGTTLAKTPFRLRVPFSNSFSNVVISSDSETDKRVIYDQNGQFGSCKNFSASCPYIIRTWFWAQCPNNAATCPQAVRIFTLAQLVQKHATPQGSGLRFPSDQRINANPYEFANFVLTSDIMNSLYMSCPEGTTMVGTTELKSSDPKIPPTNLARCECSAGYMLDRSKGTNGYDRATGWPYCKLQTCDAQKNEVMSEIDANGQIRCEVPQESSYVCRSEKVSSSGKITCKAGEKMRGLNSGDDCIINSSDVVECPDMVIKCCKKR